MGPLEAVQQEGMGSGTTCGEKKGGHPIPVHAEPLASGDRRRLDPPSRADTGKVVGVRCAAWSRWPGGRRRGVDECWTSAALLSPARHSDGGDLRIEVRRFCPPFSSGQKLPYPRPELLDLVAFPLFKRFCVLAITGSQPIGGEGGRKAPSIAGVVVIERGS